MTSTEREVLDEMDAEAKAEAAAAELKRRIEALPPEKAAEFTRRVASRIARQMIFCRVASLVLMAVFLWLCSAWASMHEGYAGLDAEYPHPLALMDATILLVFFLAAAALTGLAWIYELPPKSGGSS